MSKYVDAEFIRAEALNIFSDMGDYKWLKVILNREDVPSIDIVRCQDCKHWVYNFNGCKRNPCTEPWYATDGCTYGERNDE